MPKKKTSTTNSFGRKFKNFDVFGSVPSFEVDGGGSLNSYGGAFLSIIIITITMLFLVSRTQIWIQYGDTSH